MDFELCLFSIDPLLIKRAGVDSIIVDWENKGKSERQNGFDTQINAHSIEDLQIVRRATKANVICRINAIGLHSEVEIEKAIELGADEILIPMVRSLQEVEWALHKVDKRIGVGILIETNAAVENAVQLGQLPLSRIYVGLNDLAIENQSRNIFLPIVNGMLERVRNSIALPFGFGGLTLQGKGFPIPCRLLIGELARLGCHFSFLRRSFLADIKGKDLSFEVDRLRDAIEEAKCRTPQEVDRDQKQLIEKIKLLEVENCALI